MDWLLQAFLRFGAEIDCFRLHFPGPDGHTCSIFPGHSLSDYKGNRWILPIDDAPKPPPQRITLTEQAVMSSKAIAFIANGASKADVIQVCMF